MKAKFSTLCIAMPFVAFNTNKRLDAFYKGSRNSTRIVGAIALFVGLFSFGIRANAQVIVYTAPPPPPVVRVAPRPAVGYVWVSGYYAWRGGRYVWASGHWAVPPRPAAVWIPARWTYVPATRHYVFVAGYWR